MKDKPWTDVVRNVGSEGMEAHFLTVRPWPESPDYVCLCTEGEKNQKWFGSFNVALPADVAIALGKALIAAANELKEQA